MNSEGERFMERYAPPARDLALSRSMTTEVLDRRRTTYIYSLTICQRKSKFMNAFPVSRDCFVDTKRRGAEQLRNRSDNKRLHTNSSHCSLQQYVTSCASCARMRSGLLDDSGRYPHKIRWCGAYIRSGMFQYLLASLRFLSLVQNGKDKIVPGLYAAGGAACVRAWCQPSWCKLASGHCRLRPCLRQPYQGDPWPWQATHEDF